MDIKIFTYEGVRGGQGALSAEKNDKSTGTVPILK